MNTWTVVGSSVNRAIRAAYNTARTTGVSQVVCFVPQGYTTRTLQVRIFSYNLLERGPLSDGVKGYGNMMVYRVCSPVEPGFRAKHANMPPLIETIQLNNLVALGWNKTYQWVEIEALDPRRPVQQELSHSRTSQNGINIDSSRDTISSTADTRRRGQEG